MKIIGDVHGKVQQYYHLRENDDFSICVGDFGFKKQWDWAFENVYHEGHKIIMGNHDYYPYLHTSPFSIGNYEYWDGFNIFMVRGANSIDKHLRTEGIDWFSNEELTISEGYQALDEYLKVRPKIVISHDCPQLVMEELFEYKFKSIDPSYDKSLTRQLLQAMFEEHQPELWVFGHHHKSVNKVIDGTKFICLDELETFEL